MTAGVALWITDIIWVWVKGLENERLKMFSNYSFDSSVQNGITSFNLTVNF